MKRLHERGIMEKAQLNWNKLPFDYIKTDGHLEYTFKDGKWDDGVVTREDQMTMHIAATCLHYGQQAFEGLKVFEAKDGRVLCFRPDENARRMVRTAKKILMEPFPEEKFIEAIEKVTRLNKRFVPPYGSGASLYVRPLLIGMTGTVGVKPAREYKWLVFVTPVGPYFKNGLQPIRLMVEEVVDRAAPNGVGDVKVGGNYAAGIRASYGAKSKGFDEALYLDARHKKFIDESGATNFFGVTKDGRYVTPGSYTILPSITNMSLKTIAKDLGIPVEARDIPVEELREFVEAGCCGTAAIITPVKSITWRNEVIQYLADGEVCGPITKKLYDYLTGIQHGEIEDKYGWTHEIDVD
jgi:branched-chain amino acid aminotransferase